MKGWMNDAVQNHGNGFPHMGDGTVTDGQMMDPTSGPMGNPNSFPPSQFSANPQQVQQQQQQQRHPDQGQNTPRMSSQHQPPPVQGMPNGSMRNPSPSPFPPANGGYPTSSVIPAKRPRPVDDGAAGSPRPNPNLIPTSRSETPPQHGNFVNFSGSGMPGQQGQQQGQYSHLQGVGGSANATPSPTMAHQMRPGSVPQRVATASPHAFSPSASQFGGQGSPAPSEQGTPQPGQFSQGLAPGFASNFNASSSPGAHGGLPQQQQMTPQMMQLMGSQQPGQTPGGMLPPGVQAGMQPGIPPGGRNMTIEQQKAYQMRLQYQRQQQQQAQAAAQQGPGQGRGMPPKQIMPPNGHAPLPGQMPPGQMAPGQMAPGQVAPGQVPPGGPRPPAPQQRNDAAAFMKHLSTFMNSRGLPFEPNPMLHDRPINIMILFQQAQARGGYKSITASNGWAHLSAALGFHPSQFPAAPNFMKSVYEQSLLRFEEEVQTQRQKKQQQHQPGMPIPGQPGQHMPPRPMMQHGPMGQQLPVSSGQHPQTMVPGSFPGQAKPGQPAMPPVGPHGHPMNGGYPAAPGGMAQPATPGLAQRRDSMQFATPTGGAPMVAPSPASAHPAPGPPKLSHHSNFRTETYLPAKVTNRDSYGQVGEFDRTFRDAGIIGAMRPDVPSVLQMGNINIHALTRSIQSGIHGEVRMALDTLATISRCEVPSVYLYISACDDLLEVLMECAEDQLDLLAEHTPEVSDEIQLISYEDLVRGCQVDMLTLRRDPPFASLEYELDRAVERLLCIMTILRNLSFPPVSVTMELHMDQIGRAHQAPNGTHPLGDELVIKFLSDVVRFIGTRTMFLRTNMHTLDFMKDMVIMLSNISGYMEVPGREQAMCLLQFLVAFAPTPIPVASACDDDGIFFAAYDPTMHPYLPAAVDALAKLLARDDPNRLYFNTIFALEATGPTPYDLLTKAFALAVSPIPDQTKSNVRNNLPTIIDARMPSIMQGLLAGDILASLVPGPETGLARVWITSPSGFAQNLNHLVSQLMMMIEARPRQPPARSAPRGDQELPETLLAIRRALSMQKSLLDKSRDPYDPEGSLPAGVAPPTALAVRALDLKPDMWVKEGVLSLLLSCVQMDE